MNAEDGPRTAGFDTFANPDFLFLEQLVGTGISQPLFVQQLLLALLIFAEAAGKARQLAAIKFDDARANAVQKGTVVGNEKQRHIGFDQQVLQPFNRRDIEVVGRLIEQQNFRGYRQRLGQRQAFFLTTGKGAHLGVRVESEALNDLIGLRFVSPGTAGIQFVLQGFHARHQHLEIRTRFAHLMRHFVILSQQLRGFTHPGNHGLKNGRFEVKNGLLRHIADANAGLHPNLTVVDPPPPGTGRQRGQQG